MICLPMAGLSSRFFKAGYTIPKYMLDLEGQTVFAHALRSFEKYFGTERFLIICRAEYDTPAFVRAECEKAGLPGDHLDLVVLDHETAGQAETVAKGLEAAGVDPEQSLTVFNIDTFRPGFRYPSAFDVVEIDGYLEVFEGEGDHWSFAAPEQSLTQPNKVTRVTEKERISDLCSTGLYYFRTVGMFQQLYAGIAKLDPTTLQGGERYIAPLYNVAIQAGQDIRYDLIPIQDVRFCGTPSEYEVLGGAGPTDPMAPLIQHAQTLMNDQANLCAYEEASKALSAAVERGEMSTWHGPEKDAFYRSLLMQPVPGLHQLAHYVCHLVTSGLPDAARRLVTELKPVLLELIAGLDGLSADAQRRVVLFVASTRAFSRDWLPAAQVSQLHKAYFAQFEAADLALPYSALFHPEEFGQNQRDLVEAFIPEGALQVGATLPPTHALLLAWVSGLAIFDGPQRLGTVLQNADLCDAEQAAAARSLIIRFGQGDNAVSDAVIDQLDLAEANIADAGKPDVGKLKKLESKRYHALSAGLNRGKTALPFLAPLQRKPNVALCLSGQLRGYEQTLESWQSRLYPLIEPQVFVHSWSDIGRAGAQPHRQVLPFEGEAFTQAYRDIVVVIGLSEAKTRYPSLFSNLSEGAKVTEDQIKATYQTDHVVLEDDQADRFAQYSNQDKMHYKIHAVDALARDAGEFDLMMRIRPDLGIRDVGFAWGDLLDAARSGPVLFAEKGYGVHYGGLLAGDQCAIGTPETMKHYADTWLTFSKLSKLELAQCPTDLTGHVSLAQTCWLAGVDILRAPIRFTTLSEARRLSVAECLAAIEKDSTGTADDLRLIDAARADLRAA